VHERRIGPEEAGRMLNVDYVVSGSARRQSKRLNATVELTETRTAFGTELDAFDAVRVQVRGERKLTRPRPSPLQ